MERVYLNLCNELPSSRSNHDHSWLDLPVTMAPSFYPFWLAWSPTICKEPRIGGAHKRDRAREIVCKPVHVNPEWGRDRDTSRKERSTKALAKSLDTDPIPMLERKLCLLAFKTQRKNRFINILSYESTCQRVKVSNSIHMRLTVYQSFPNGIADSPGSGYNMKKCWIIARWSPRDQNQQQTGMEYESNNLQRKRNV